MAGDSALAFLRNLSVACFLTGAFLLSSCSTVVGKAYRFVLDENDPISRYVDGSVVQTSVQSHSAVEMSLTTGKDFFTVNLYVQNIANKAFNFGPANVRMMVFDQRKGLTYDSSLNYLYEGMAPEVYADYLARRRSGYASSTGMVSAYLSGATIGEAIIAQNQLGVEVEDISHYRVSEEKSIRKELIGLTTVRPGEALSGGVGLRMAGYFPYITDKGGNRIVNEGVRKSAGSKTDYDFFTLMDGLPDNPSGILSLPVSDPNNILGAANHPYVQSDFMAQGALPDGFTPRVELVVKVGEDVHVFHLNVQLVEPYS